jgi:hypothetical protein
MIGGVRSPMASPGHGLVAKGPVKPLIKGASRKSAAGGPTNIRSPQDSRDNV